MRMLVVDAVQHAKAGHPGMALGMAEVGYVCWKGMELGAFDGFKQSKFENVEIVQ